MKVYFAKNSHDYPKKHGDVRLSWYQNGNICILKRKAQPTLQVQNIRLKLVNSVCKEIWKNLSLSFKKDLYRYSIEYRKVSFVLRKRGISAYSVLLMIVNALIKRFCLNTESYELLLLQVNSLMHHMTIYLFVKKRLIKAVKNAYRLNARHGVLLDFNPFLRNNTERLIANEMKGRVFVYDKTFHFVQGMSYA